MKAILIPRATFSNAEIVGNILSRDGFKYTHKVKKGKKNKGVIQFSAKADSLTCRATVGKEDFIKVKVKGPKAKKALRAYGTDRIPVGEFGNLLRFIENFWGNATEAKKTKVKSSPSRVAECVSAC